MGKKIVLTGTTLTDLSAPRFAVIDPIESTGSLMLVEVSHPAGSWAGGVPATTTTVPNLFASNLATLGGVGVAGPPILITGAIANLTKGKLERSTKGGLHVIVSKAVSLASGDGVRFQPSEALRDYLTDNPTHDYYFSAWDRITRSSTTNPSDYAMVSASTNTGLGFLAGASNWVANSSEGVNIISSRPFVNTVGPRLVNSAFDKSGTIYPDNTHGPMWGAPSNSYNNTIIGTRNGGWSSFVFYRMYFEDLTVSGRSYSQVDAIDYDLYTQQILTAGGRYYGDTFTNPTTIP